VAWARVQLGHLYFGAGDLASAEAEYRRSLQTLPGYVYGRAGLGRAAAARGDYGGAITHYQSAIERVAIPEFVIALGDVYRAAGREDEARAQYELVDAIDRLYKANGVNTDLELALFYADRDLRLDEALRQARAQYEQRHTVYTADVLAWALYQNGRPEEAKPYSDEALRLGTRDARLLFHAGMIARTLGDAERARSLLARALETNPHFSLLHHDEAQRALAELEESEALAERGD